MMTYVRLIHLGGLLSYTAPPSRNDGAHEPVDWAENLDDISYDGLSPAQAAIDHHRAVPGLGQLTDGILTDNRTSINGSFFGKLRAQT